MDKKEMEKMALIIALSEQAQNVPRINPNDYKNETQSGVSQFDMSGHNFGTASHPMNLQDFQNYTPYLQAMARQSAGGWGPPTPPSGPGQYGNPSYGDPTQFPAGVAGDRGTPSGAAAIKMYPGYWLDGSKN